MEKLWDTWHQDPKSMKEVQKEQRNTPRKQPAKASQGRSKAAVA
jgi:hypothetical protein